MDEIYEEVVRIVVRTRVKNQERVHARVLNFVTMMNNLKYINECSIVDYQIVEEYAHAFDKLNEQLSARENSKHENGENNE